MRNFRIWNPRMIGKMVLSMTLVLVMAVLAGCGNFQLSLSDEETEYDDSDLDSYLNADEDLLVVGFSQIGSESVWRTANTTSMQEALTKENGFFLIYENARQKQENQIKAIRGFISQRLDYIVFSPVTESGWDTVLQEANEAGIPVLIMDRKISTSDPSLFRAWIGSDTENEGKKAGRWLEEYLEENGRQEEEVKILVLSGTEDSSAQKGRSEGFQWVAEEHDNWTILEEKSGDFTKSRAEEVMTEFIEKYDDFDVLVCQNDDMAFGALEVMQEAGITTGVDGDVILISFDATKEALELVQEGIINVDVECNPLLGELVVEIIQDLENGEMVKKYNDVEEMVFTQENVSEYLEDRVY